jgi:hypothetical protein
VILETGKSKICSVVWEAHSSAELAVQWRAVVEVKGSPLQNSLLLKEAKFLFFFFCSGFN